MATAIRSVTCTARVEGHERDTTACWELQADGSWRRRHATEEELRTSSQGELMRRALERRNDGGDGAVAPSPVAPVVQG